MKLLVPDEERQLIQRLCAREEQAMALFYQRYHRALYQVIWRIVRHDELAEDILQESMLKFWLSVATYDATRGRLFTWALNISRNLAIDYVREARYWQAQQTISLSEGFDHLVATTSFEPEHIGVRDWLDLLATHDRELLETIYFKGHTQAEAAEQLHLSLGTVKSRLYRLIQALAHALK
jgi:RNA polymerase sigma factor (sigma-70 family)